jgi:hypothetical protein
LYQLKIQFDKDFIQYSESEKIKCGIVLFFGRFSIAIKIPFNSASLFVECFATLEKILGEKSLNPPVRGFISHSPIIEEPELFSLVMAPSVKAIIILEELLISL